MSIAAITSAPVPSQVPPAATAPTPVRPAVATSTARAADGDYKVRSAATSQTKDADGDYKPAVSAAAATSSSAVMAAVTSLTKGG
jgi:hypothetical protein